MTTTRKSIIAAALCILAACSTVAESTTTSSVGEKSDESTSSSESSDTGDESDPDDGVSSLDGWPLDIPDGTPAESETGEQSHGACCFCAYVEDDPSGDESNTTDTDTGTGEGGSVQLWCYGWNDTEASCIAWLGENIETLYDPDCPEAWTDNHDDDWYCDAVCF